MDSVEDTMMSIPADTSNLSTPAESSSSDDSQPTVKLGSNVTTEHDEQHRNNDKPNEPRWRNDCHDEPFFDMLDQDGRRLVEKTGRTAQRARFSVRPRLSRFNADKIEARTNNWLDDGRDTRKCRSTTCVLDSRESGSGLKNRRRHYSCGMERSRLIRPEPEVTPKRYSAGDYLRQQILEDLGSNELIGKTEEQIAEDRCNRVRAYLRREKTMDSSSARPEVNEFNAAGKHDLDRIRKYLEDKIRKKMNQERTRGWQMTRSSMKYPSEPSLGDIGTRYFDYRGIEETTTRPAEIVQPIAERFNDKFSRTAFSQRREEKKAANGDCGRTRGDVVPETVIDPDDGEVRKRFRSYSAGQRKFWRTRSCLTFEKKLSLPSGESSMNLERDTRSSFVDEPSSDHDDNVGGKNRKKYRPSPTTRSGDMLAEKMTATIIGGRRANKGRSVSWSDKRKLHRRRIDRDETSYDSEPDRKNDYRGAKIQLQGYSCSWREYKEKRMIERRMNRRTDYCELRHSIELDSSIPTAGSKDFPTRFYESQVGDTTETPKVHVITANRAYEENGAIVDVKIETNGPTITNDNEPRKVGETNDDTETETILQENYLLVEKGEIERSRELDSSLSMISRLRVDRYLDLGMIFDGTNFDKTITNRDENGGADSFVEFGTGAEYNMPDFGYDTIPKRGGKNCDVGGERCHYDFKSRVKKSDTFKIVDGSEDALDDDCQKPMRMSDDLIVTSRRSSNASKSWSNVLNLLEEIDDKIDRRHCAIADRPIDDDASTRSNKDVAGDYFRRVYEFLKERRKNGGHDDTGMSSQSTRRKNFETSSSSNGNEKELRKRRRRRRKKYKNRGEEIVGVSPGIGIGIGIGIGVDDGWTVNPVDNLKFRRPRLENVNGHKRPRNPAPPVPKNFTINAKDIGKYFDYPNKENSGLPGNAVNNRIIELKETNDRKSAVETRKNEMGSNLSRHNGKGLTGRRTQSSGNLCDPKGKLNHVGKILVPCSSSQRERYKICGSLPNNLDDKEIVDDENPGENNNVISDTMVGNLGGTLPHKKRTLGVHFSDTGPTGTLDLVKHRSQDSLEGDPWRYQDGADLDLVRCQHGNFDPVRKNESSDVDVVDGDASSGRRYGTVSRVTESKCHHAGDLDLVGTLPKRRSKDDDPKGAALRQSFESRKNRTIDGDSSIKFTHKPDCELVKHRQFDRVVDLKLSRLMGGEPQDQGYASERSPEDEHPPSLPGQHFPNVNPESTFCVTLQKSSRGLGLSVSGGGTAGPVRVKRLFPQQPAALSNKLQSGDVLLAANGIPLTGLTNYEALEVLRTTPSTVELVVCRLPGDAAVTPPGAPPPPPTRREPPPPPLRILNPLPPLQIEPCGEFDIEMTKVAGSLGFTLRKVDSSALGHYVRALVREPALSDGRIQPGDKIIAVDGATLSPMSHEEAVALLRQCGPTVKLRLYRDLAQTPVSALSPTEPDHPLRPSRTSLRQEAVDMLCDLAVRKLSPGTSNGSDSRQTSGASCNSPRRLRRPPSRTSIADNEEDNHLTFHPVNRSNVRNTGSEIDRIKTMDAQTADSQSDTPSNDIIDPPPLYDVCDSVDSLKLALRPSFLDLGTTMEKPPHLKFSLESETEYTGATIVTESHSSVIGKCADYEDDCTKNVTIISSDEHDGYLPSEPASMPPLQSTTRTTNGVFSYKNPAYQSANPTCGGIDNSTKNKTAHSSDQDIPGKVLGAEDPAGSKGLLKWKGVMFAPDDDTEEAKEVEKTEIDDDDDDDDTGKEEEEEEGSVNRQITSEDENEVFMVELTRGWNSRLGFSLQPEGNSTVISVVHPDSVAAKDGRLKQGDVLILVNDESVEKMPTTEIIDLLRKIRGSIGITVMRKNKMKNSS